MDPITILAGIKTGLAAGKTVAGLSKQIGQFFDATDQAKKTLQKKGISSKSANATALDRWAKIRQAAEAEEELKEWITQSYGRSKYLELLNEKRLSLKSYEVKYNQLLKKKWLWYTDKLSKEEIDELGWAYDPFDGHRVIKQDYNYYFNADKDLSDLKLKVEYLTECVDALKEILNIITWRHQSIKNAIDWLKFTNPAG